MPYFVREGQQVDTGHRSYLAGEALPPGVGDAAMREAGVVEWREAEKAAKPAAAPKRRVVK